MRGDVNCGSKERGLSPTGSGFLLLLSASLSSSERANCFQKHLRIFRSLTAYRLTETQMWGREWETEHSHWKEERNSHFTLLEDESIVLERFKLLPSMADGFVFDTLPLHLSLRLSQSHVSYRCFDNKMQIQKFPLYQILTEPTLEPMAWPGTDHILHRLSAAGVKSADTKNSWLAL